MLSYDKGNKNIWREVTDSEELVSLLQERNADHLRQATLNGTPFTTAPLKEIFGLYGTSKTAEKIIAGTFNIKSLGLSEEVMTWLEELAYDEDGPQTSVDIKNKDKHFKSAVRVCNENTSASPSGFGYVVWKACGLSPSASRVHSTMTSLPFEHGFAPSL